MNFQPLTAGSSLGVLLEAVTRERALPVASFAGLAAGPGQLHRKT